MATENFQVEPSKQPPGGGVHASPRRGLSFASGEKGGVCDLYFVSRAGPYWRASSGGGGASVLEGVVAEDVCNSASGCLNSVASVLRRACDLLRVVGLLLGVYVCGVIDGVSLHRCFFFLRNCSTILKRTVLCFFINGLFAAAAVSAGQLLTPALSWLLRGSLRVTCGCMWGFFTALATLSEAEGMSAAFERGVSAASASAVAGEAVAVSLGGSAEALFWFCFKYGALYPVYLLSSFYLDVAEHGLALLGQEEARRLRELEATEKEVAAREALDSAVSEEAREKARLRWEGQRRVLAALLSESKTCEACRWGQEQQTQRFVRRHPSCRGRRPSPLCVSGSSPDALLLRPVLQYAWWFQASLLLPLVPVFGPFLSALNSFWMAAFWCFDLRRRKRGARLFCLRQKRMRRTPSGATLAALGLSPVHAAALPSFRIKNPRRRRAGAVSSERGERRSEEEGVLSEEEGLLSEEEGSSGDAAAALDSWLSWFERHWSYFAGFGTPVCVLLQCLQRHGADNAELAAAAVLLPLSILLALRASPRRCLARSREKARRERLLLSTFPLLNRVPIFAFVRVFADLAVDVLGTALSLSARNATSPSSSPQTQKASSANSTQSQNTLKDPLSTDTPQKQGKNKDAKESGAESLASSSNATSSSSSSSPSSSSSCSYSSTSRDSRSSTLLSESPRNSSDVSASSAEGQRAAVTPNDEWLVVQRGDRSCSQRRKSPLLLLKKVVSLNC